MDHFNHHCIKVKKKGCNYRIVIRAFVQHVGSVLLGGGGGRQMDNDHLEHSLTSWQPVPHDSLHQRLA